MIYDHRQRAGWLNAVLITGAAAVLYLALYTSERRALSLAALSLGAVAWLFGSLRVLVDERQITAEFGPGFIRRRVRWDDVADARAVRNNWLMGWGIRMLPNGWMFNVSGLDAVELVLKSGRVFRIGTDEPEGLLEAIRQARAVKRRWGGG